MPRRIQRYGWKPDLPDHRDYRFQVHMRPRLSLPTQLLDSVDLTNYMPPVVDQGQLGSCVSCATTSLLEYNKIVEGWSFQPLSRLFAYYNARVAEGDPDQDAGCQIRDMISCLASEGICPESEWPYDPAQVAVKPGDQCYTDALKDEISVYARIETLDDMLQCLAGSHPFLFGISVYESFESDAVAQTGVVPMPDTSEDMVGGHAILAVGYSQPDKTFVFRNSWGTSWGKSGYGTIPFDYLTNPNLCGDMWSISK